MSQDNPNTPSPLEAADPAGNPDPSVDPQQQQTATAGDGQEPFQTNPNETTQAQTDTVDPHDPFEVAQEAWEHQRQQMETLQGDQSNSQGEQAVGEGEHTDTTSAEPTEAQSEEGPDPLQVLEQAGFDTQNLPDHLDEEGAYNFGRYWQSKHDKTQQRVDELENQLEEVEALAPVVQQIQQDPELMNVVAEHLEQRQGGQPMQASPDAPSQPASTAPAQGESLQMPEPPEKPEGFDRYEAVTDPDSESAKYLEEKEQYMEELADYNQRLVQVQQQRQQQLEQHRQQQVAQQQLLNEVMYEHDLSQDQAQQFLQWAQSDDSIGDVEAWVQAWKAKNDLLGNAPAPSAEEQAPQQNGQAQNGQDVTLTPAQRARQRQRQNAQTQARTGPQFPNSATSQRGPSQQPQGDDALFAMREEANPVFGT